MIARALLRRRRLEMDLVAAGLEEFPLFGRYNYRHAMPGLADHSHGQRLEICYLVKGRQTYRTAGQDYRLQGGDVFIAFPHEKHSTGNAPEEKGTLYWLIVSAPKANAPFLGLSSQHGRALWQAVSQLQARHFKGTRKMKELLDAATVAYHSAAVWRLATVSHCLTGFLLELAACGLASPPPRRRSLDQVLRHMNSHLDEPLSVPALAAIARLSVSHFKARFIQETGLPPGEYQTRLRIKEAQRRLLLGRQSVTEVAFDLGFSSSQYFATVFKRFTGLNPGSQLGMARGSS